MSSNTYQGEPAPAVTPSLVVEAVSLSRFDRYLDRFLRDDGTICLFVLLLLFGIRKVYLWVLSLKAAASSSETDNNSIIGLESSDISMTNESSMMNSASSDGSSNGSSNSNSNHSKVVIVEPTKRRSVSITLVRMLMMVVGASAFGYILGNSLSDNVEARALVGFVVSLVGSEPTTAAITPAATTETPATNPSDSHPSTPTSSQTSAALLEKFLQEHQGKSRSLPAFADTDASSQQQQQQALDRRKHFAEFVVHPVLMVSGTEDHPDEPSERVAVAVHTDGLELAKDLLSEIVSYRAVTHVTILLVSSEAASNHDQECPSEVSTEDFPVTVDCLNVDPSWGHAEEGRVEDLLPDDGYDVSIVLSGCDSASIQDRLWEKELYDATDSMVLTCTGPKRSFGRSLTAIGVTEQHLRIDRIEQLFTNAEGESAEHNSYTQIVDYDVQSLNLAVAFHENMDDGSYKWHLNEANYNTELSWRLRDGARDQLLYFEGPDMLNVQFPTKQSANSYCRYMDDYDDFEDKDEYFCDYGYDPYLTNIPIEQIYVGQSTSGENAGRGVFTSVDIVEEGTYLGMETGVHPVEYPPMSKALVDAVVDMKIYDNYDDAIIDDDDDDDNDEDAYIGGDSPLMSTSLHRAPSTYAEAYGFDDDAWGIPQTSVFSNILTFTNHGCNGTANIGHNVPGLNEFTMDTSSPNFEIPAVFRQFSSGEYSPHRDRAYLGSICTSQVEHPPIYKGQELFDNYIGFGGDTAFVEQINELKRDCSGALGTVELHQLLQQTKRKNKSKSDPLHHKRRRSKEAKDGESSEEETSESAGNENEEEEDDETSVDNRGDTDEL